MWWVSGGVALWCCCTVQYCRCWLPHAASVMQLCDNITGGLVFDVVLTV